MKIRYAFPLILFLAVIIVLWRGLSLHPNEIPSPLINQSAPSFTLPLLHNPKNTTSNKDFKGHITLVNVWATWCYACAEEHEFLLHLAQSEHLLIYGLNYKDDPKAAIAWLAKYGNPYYLVARDQDGLAAINWGVYGTPETFILDQRGVIRYKQIGAITPQIWETTLKPLIETLRDENK